MAHLYGNKKRSSAYRILNQFEDLSNFADTYGPPLNLSFRAENDARASASASAQSNADIFEKIGMPGEAPFTVKVDAVLGEMRVPENFSNIRIPSKQQDQKDPRGVPASVKANAATTGPSKSESAQSRQATVVSGVKKEHALPEMRVPENFSHIQIPSKRDFFDLRGVPVSDEPPEEINANWHGDSFVAEDGDDDFVKEDAAPWDDPETGYQLLLLDNIEGTGAKTLGFQNPMQLAQGAAPPPLTWPLGQLHLARASSCTSSVLAPARAMPSLRDRRPRSAPSTRPQIPQPAPLAEEVRGVLRATPVHLLLSPREAEYLEEEEAPRLAQKLRLEGTGSAFPNQYLASLPVQIPETGKLGDGGYLQSRSKNASKGPPPSMLHVNGVQMGRASSTGALMITNTSWNMGSEQPPFESDVEFLTAAPEPHLQRPTSAKVLHIPSASKASAHSKSEARRQRPASAPGARSSTSGDTTGKLQHQRPASAKFQQITIFQEARAAEKTQRPASAMAACQDGQTENSLQDESCCHQLLDATLDLRESFQSTRCFNSFPPRARPQSRPQSAQSMPDCRQSVAMRGAQRCSPQVELSTQAITDAFTLKTPFGFGSFPVKATERYCRRGRRDPSKVDRTASRAPHLKRPSSAPALRSGCGSKHVRANNCRALLSRPKN
jgi:hypothetical protein